MAKTTKNAPAKYSDKSGGQTDLLPIFEKLKKMVSVYAKEGYTVKADKPAHYELYYGKEIEISGRKYPEQSFASLLIQKGYVGFYFFPIYINDAIKKELAPGLIKTLKGKTCFHIKKDDPELMNGVKDALQIGYDYYISQGWK